MKILMLGWELPPYNSGGLGVACYQLCKALSSHNVDIEFIVPYAGHPPVDFMKITSATKHRVDSFKLEHGAYDSSRFIHAASTEEHLTISAQHDQYEAGVAKLVETSEFDVIHAHDWLTFRAGLRAKQITGRPLIAHVHSIESDRAGGGYGNPIVREIEQLGLLSADKIIAVSGHTKRAIEREYRIPGSKIDVVHNCIDQESIEPLSDMNVYTYLTEMKKLGYKVVSNIGRLTIQKGLPNLLHAAAKVIDKHPKTFFLIVGSGEQYTELIELAAQLGISRNVLFTGFLRGQKWRDAYAIADLFVMPSISEPFGLTPFEAAAYGTPSLISKQSGIAEVFAHCLKIDYWDINEMANQITSVVTNYGLQQTLTIAAQTEFNELSWHDSARKLRNIYALHHAGETV